MKSKVCAIVCSAVFFMATESGIAQEVNSVASSSAADANSTPVADTSADGASTPTQSDVLVVGRKPANAKLDLKHPQGWFNDYLPYEERVAGWVDNTARSIDRFFGTDDAWRVDNESWLRLTNDLRWEQDKGVSNDLRPRVKLDLPTASERLHLLIESDSPEQRTAAQEAVPSLRTTDDRRRTTVFGLGTNFDGWLPEWKKQFQAGIRVALPLDPYARFIVRRDVPLQGQWELNSYNRVAWFEHDGYSANSEIKIGEPLSPSWRLYYGTDLSWKEKRDYLEFAQTANLAHILSERSAITYTVGLAGTGFQGPQITSYFLTADYRRNIAHRIVFMDVIPEFSLPKDYGFDPHWAITLRLELYFQKKIDAAE